MSLIKPTDMSCNRSVFMPGPRSAIEEAALELRRKMWMKEADEFMKIQCDERGIQKERNLSEAAERGRVKVMKMVRKKEAIVMPSDKGKGICVVHIDLYQRMGEDHTAQDEEIGWDQIRKCQAILNGNNRSLNRIFRIGEAGGSRAQLRCFDISTTWADHAPK